MSTLKLPQLAWYGPSQIELEAPSGWKVETSNMAGAKLPALQPAEIEAALSRPIGSPLIRELARGKKEAVIIFDDMTRVTRPYLVIPYLLKELAAGGIDERHIRFISALGCHGSISRSDFVRKLGEDIVARFPVYNHNSIDKCCTLVGTTTAGLKVSANAEVMQCDLKIGIGTIEPHNLAGFGGGSKIILPGVCSLGTNESYHLMAAELVRNAGRPVGMGISAGNPVRPLIEEVGTLVGLDFKIDTIYNEMGEVTHLFCGKPQMELEAGVEIAREHFVSPRVADKDIIIANTFSKVNEPMSAISSMAPLLKKEGGDLVLINNSPEGHVVHYLFGTFGRLSGGILWKKGGLSERVKRLIIFSEYPEGNFTIPFGAKGNFFSARTWKDVLDILGDRAGSRMEVGVYPHAEVQYFRS